MKLKYFHLLLNTFLFLSGSKYLYVIMFSDMFGKRYQILLVSRNVYSDKFNIGPQGLHLLYRGCTSSKLSEWIQLRLKQSAILS